MADRPSPRPGHTRHPGPHYRIALRPDDPTDQAPDGRNEHVPLDDIVVKDVRMFRAEMMHDRSLWMRCYLNGGDESIDFSVSVDRQHHLVVKAYDGPAREAYETRDTDA